MADSHSLPEAVSPSALGPIYDLLLSVGYADAGKTDVSGFNRVSGGLAWCISTVNKETLTSQDEIEVEKRIEEALRLIGCPCPLEASQIETLDCKAVLPVVQWLVDRVRVLQDDSRDYEVSKNQTGRKRKQPVSSSGPASSSGTANTAGPSPSSAHSTPCTHTPGDVMSMPALPHSGSSSKPLMMFGADGPGTLASPSNQLWDDKDLELQADFDRFVEDEDNAESFLSHDDTDPRDTVGHGMDVSKGFTFADMNSVRASTSKVICCHFSSDGKLLASGGHDKKAVLWYTDSLKMKSSLEEHSALITDVCFSPTMPRLATSSFDKTVRVWDADNPGYSLRIFTGHSASVMSLDFHPSKDDVICSCDEDGEIRYWSINNGSCSRVFKGGTTQVRFQPRLGRYLAAAAENVVSIFDVETQACRHSLKGHTKSIQFVCWDRSGEFLASVSEDSVRVWALGSGSEGECVHEHSGNGHKFYSCVFHPTYPSLLVIGCYQSLELWNMTENTTITLWAHEGLIAALAVSTVTGLVASGSHDKFVKLWNCGSDSTVSQ